MSEYRRRRCLRREQAHWSPASSCTTLGTGEVWEQDVDGFFVAIGHIPNTAPFIGQIDLDADGYVVSHGGARTNINGVFHAGDVQDRVYRQAITASGPAAWRLSKWNVFLKRRGTKVSQVREWAIQVAQ